MFGAFWCYEKKGDLKMLKEISKVASSMLKMFLLVVGGWSG
jgi:hypothetical protein